MKYGTIVFILILAIAGMFVFQDAFRIYFTHEILACYIIYFTFADDFYIPECFYSNAFGHFPEYFLEIQGVYRPLITCLFALDYILWGLNSFGYHLTNFLFHLLNAYLVFLLAYRIISSRIYAMLCSACFFFHAWNGSPVITLIQLSGVACTTFYLLTVLCFIQYREKTAHVKIWLAGVFAGLIMAVLSYELAVTIPVLLFAADLFLTRGEGAKLSRINLTAIYHRYRVHIPIFLFICFYIIFRLIIFHGIGGYPAIDTDKSPHAIIGINMAINYWGYLTGFISECIPYPVMAAILYLVFVISYMVMDRKAVFLLAWVFFTPLPVINLVVNPYYFYLPSIGVILLLYGFLHHFFRRTHLEKPGLAAVIFISILMYGFSALGLGDDFYQRYTDNLDTLDLVEDIYSRYPVLPENTTIYLVIPQLIGRDNMGRNYYDISLEHLLQLKYNQRFLRCHPFPVIVKHRKFSNLEKIRLTKKPLFLQRYGTEIIEFKNLDDAMKNVCW